MNEIGETWDAIKERLKKEKEEESLENMKILENSDLHFTIHNNGLHCRVYGEQGKVVSYWPTKDKWMIDGQKYPKYDVHKMISYLKDIS